MWVSVDIYKQRCLAFGETTAAAINHLLNTKAPCTNSHMQLNTSTTWKSCSNCVCTTLLCILQVTFCYATLRLQHNDVPFYHRHGPTTAKQRLECQATAAPSQQNGDCRGLILRQLSRCPWCSSAWLHLAVWSWPHLPSEEHGDLEQWLLIPKSESLECHSPAHMGWIMTRHTML